MKKYFLISLFFVISFFILSINSAYALKPAGCTETSNYSITTGQSCNENGVPSVSLPSCSMVSGYKLITGQTSCSVFANTNTVFNFKAKDPENDNLSWSINWGDGQGIQRVCPSSQPNRTFSVSHAWANAGTHSVRLGVSDCRGGDIEATFNVVVKPSNSSTPSTPPTTNPTSPTSPTSQDKTNLKGEFISFDSVLLTWDPIHTTGYKGGYNIYKNGSLFARTRTDFVNGKPVTENPTAIYDKTVKCPSTQRYQVELFQYDSKWNIIPSGVFSEIATVVSSSCLNPTISIISPKKSETYNIGSTIDISWRATGITSANNSIAVSVYKYRSDDNYYGVSPEFGQTVSNNISNGIIQDTGSYQWKIPSSFVSGDYIVLVSGSTGKTISEKFSITAQSSTGSLPVGCTETTIFSTVTGKPCKPEANPSSVGPTFLLPPLNLKGTATSQTSILITWDPVEGTDGYNIYRAGKLIARTLKGNTSWYDENLSCGINYSYYVEGFKYGYAIQPTGSGNFSSAISASTSSCSTYPSMKVLSPNGGEIFKVGDTVNISWKATGITSSANSIGVSIYKHGGFSLGPIFSITRSNDMNGSVVLDTGSYNWTIPSSFVPGNYVIWLNGTSGKFFLQDNSDAYFVIKSGI